MFLHVNVLTITLLILVPKSLVYIYINLIPCAHQYILYLSYYIVYKLPYSKLIYQSRYTIYVFNY